MKIINSVFTIILLTVTVQIASGQTKSKPLCLPNGITNDTVVSATLAEKPNVGKKVYVKDELKRLNAKCVKKKLVDGKNRQIKFYLLIGCWGKLPPDAQEILNRQATKIAELRKKYTVITIICNSSGVPYP